MPTVLHVSITDDALIAELADGRTVSMPLAWYPRLLHGSAAERQNWRLIGSGESLHWPDLDAVSPSTFGEDISVENILLGKASGESQGSLKRWLEQRSDRSFPR